ncbi:MAG: glycosyltransferase [Fusobacteriaceae bacterium]|jgi:dolichol-phosphate mannosyltransferase|nr:glycosyltransferase [Fusobacteriaceae bacterium]
MKDKEKNFISVVLYIHNAESQIEEFLKFISKVLEENFLKYEIILVNDYSTDKSIDIVKTWTKKDNKSMINIVNMSYYQGVEVAMNAGMDLAIGDFVYEFDNLIIDYEENLFFDIYQRSLRGFDIVAALPDSINKERIIKLFYKIYNFSANNFNKHRLERETFRIISRRGINRVNSLSKTIPYRKILYINCGLPYDSIFYSPLKHVNKFYDKLQRKNRFNTAINTLILFTDLAYKFTVLITIILMITTIVTTCYAVFIYINKEPVRGWTTSMLFLSISFFGVFLLFSIILKYLSILVDLSFRKKDYLIESIDKITK